MRAKAVQIGAGFSKESGMQRGFWWGGCGLSPVVRACRLRPQRACVGS